jgi:hypothetical protein
MNSDQLGLNSVFGLIVLSWMQSAEIITIYMQVQDPNPPDYQKKPFDGFRLTRCTGHLPLM